MNGRLVDVLLVDANEAFCTAAGMPCDQVRGRLARQFLPVLENRIEAMQTFLQDLGEVTKTGQPRSREVFLSNLSRYYRYQIFPLNNGLVGVIGVEITHQDQQFSHDRERLEMVEVRSLQQEAQIRIQHKIIEMREAERQQTANYLHEGLLQALIGIRYAIDEGLGIEQKDDRLARLAAVQATLQREIQGLRDYCNELRPPTLAQFGLEKTIRAYVEFYQKKHLRPTVTMSLAPDRQRLPDPHRLALFRIFQELFNRFASDPATQDIFVQFGMEPEYAMLEITHDSRWPGPTMDWVELAQQGEISLSSAMGSVEGLGGRCEIQPLPDNKNKVCIHIPVNS